MSSVITLKNNEVHQGQGFVGTDTSIQFSRIIIDDNRQDFRLRFNEHALRQEIVIKPVLRSPLKVQERGGYIKYADIDLSAKWGHRGEVRIDLSQVLKDQEFLTQ